MRNQPPAPEFMTSSAGLKQGMYNSGLSHINRDHDGVLVRLLSPLGDYPLGTINHREAAMAVRPDVSAIITTFKRIEEPEDYYSEIDYLSPFEVRFLASVLLSLRGDLNYLGLYPAPCAMERPYAGIDLSDAVV